MQLEEAAELALMRGQLLVQAALPEEKVAGISVPGFVSVVAPR